MSDQTTTVYVVDDSPLECDSICTWLAEVGIETVPLGSGRDFVFECRNDGPVVAVLDMQMTMNGEDTYTVMKMRGLGWVPTMFISNTSDIDVVGRVMRAGAMAFMSKRPENKEQLQQMVRDAMAEAEAIYASGKKNMPASPLSKLTPRQIDIWVQYAKHGLRRKVDIAKALGISESTVSTLMARMLATLGVNSMDGIAKRYGNIDLQKLHEIVTKFL